MPHDNNPIKIITQTIDTSKINIDYTIWYVLYCHAFSDLNVRAYLSQFARYNDIPLQILPISEVVDLITPTNWL